MQITEPLPNLHESSLDHAYPWLYIAALRFYWLLSVYSLRPPPFGACVYPGFTLTSLESVDIDAGSFEF